MQDRRTFLGLAAASLLPVALDAQAPAPRPAAELARHALTGPFEGFEVVLVELNMPRRLAQRRPGPPSSGGRPRLRRRGADAFCHQQRAGKGPAGGRHVLRAVRRRSHHERFCEVRWAHAGGGLHAGAQGQPADRARLISRTLGVCGEVAERLKAAVC